MLKELISKGVCRFQEWKARQEIKRGRALIAESIQRGIIEEQTINILKLHPSVIAVLELSRKRDVLIEQIRSQNPNLPEVGIQRLIKLHPQLIEWDAIKTELKNSFSIGQLGAWYSLEIERDEERLRSHQL